MNKTIYVVFMQTVLFAAGQLALFSTGSCQDADAQLFERLASVGVGLPQGTFVPIPPPSLTSVETKAERTAILEGLSGKLGWKKFSRKSVVAPVTIKVQYLKNDTDERIGHSIYSAFIAYTAMETLRDKELMEAMFGRPGKKQDGNSTLMADLSDDQLKSLGLQDFNTSQEGYAKLELPLLNKVIVRGIIHMQKREGPDWFELCWEVDPRFTIGGATSATSVPLALRNTWTKLVPNHVGKQQESEPVAYKGCGGYISVYKTGLAQDQLLVESRMILHEPREWFAAGNHLRSKLPLSLQESARNFRRKLLKREAIIQSELADAP